MRNCQHASVTDGYCDACGLRVTGAPAANGTAPEPPAGPATAGPAGGPGASGVSAGGGSCPSCGIAWAGGRFCEGCGYDRETGGGPPPPRIPVPPAPAGYPGTTGATGAHGYATPPPVPAPPPSSAPVPLPPPSGPAYPHSAPYPAPSAPAPHQRPAYQQPPEPAPPPSAPQPPPRPDRWAAAPPHPQPPAPVAPVAWHVIVWADPAYYQSMVDQDELDPSVLTFPSHYPQRRMALVGPEILIGRRSQSRGIYPHIDLGPDDGRPGDPAVSARHALLRARGDGTWALVDPGSTNGTKVNGMVDRVDVNVEIPLNEGDRIYIGAWTVITMQKG